MTAASLPEVMDLGAFRILPSRSCLREVFTKTDREIKRKEYAAAGVVEYWIVDPDARTVDIYEAGRHFAGDDVLTSVLLEGFSMPLAELFAGE